MVALADTAENLLVLELSLHGFMLLVDLGGKLKYSRQYQKHRVSVSIRSIRFFPSSPCAAESSINKDPWATQALLRQDFSKLVFYLASRGKLELDVIANVGGCWVRSRGAHSLFAELGPFLKNSFHRSRKIPIYVKGEIPWCIVFLRE